MSERKHPFFEKSWDSFGLETSFPRHLTLVYRFIEILTINSLKLQIYTIDVPRVARRSLGRLTIFFLSSSHDETLWRRKVRAILPNNVSTKLSQDL